MDNLDLENKVAPNGNPPAEWEDEAKIERWKQQLEWSKQEALIQRQERIWEWKELLLEDVNNLNRLAKVKDTKIVWDVLSELGYNSLEEALVENWLSTSKKEEKKDWMTKEELEKWYEDRKTQDIHNLAITKIWKVFEKLPEDEKEIAQKNFDKITKWKTLTIEEAEEYADMAILYAWKDKIVKTSNWLIDLAWIWYNKNDKWKQKDLLDSIIDNW